MAPPYAARQRDQTSEKERKGEEEERRGKRRREREKERERGAGSRGCVENGRKCTLAGRFLKIKWRPRRRSSDVAGDREEKGEEGEGTNEREREIYGRGSRIREKEREDHRREPAAYCD